MRPILLFTILMLSRLSPLAGQQERSYRLAAISPELLPGAFAVLRENNLDLVINSPASIEAHYHRAITILNTKGADWGKIVLPYDQFNKLRNISIQLFDADGQPGKKFAKKDLEDLSMLDDVTMAEDSRYLFLDLSAQPLPYTLVLDYTVASSSALFCPDFLPQPNFYTAVENAGCSVTVNSGQTLLHKSERSPQPQISREQNGNKYLWTFSHLKAVPDEPFNLPLSQLVPVIRLNAGDFEISGFTGSFKSWNGFANWSQQMLNSLPPLAADTQAEIQQITAGMSENEKIRAVYRYLQNNTRYVSIQLGIGGWKPFDPNFVHNKKYGDCKALSWYAKTLLDAVGVNAAYTLIAAGDDPRQLDPDFPNNSFNHVILTVPTSAGDTVFLECTSQQNPFGYMGSFTGNRKALAIEQGRGRVIEVAAPGSTENLRIDSVQMTLGAEQSTPRLKWKAVFQGTAIEDESFYSAALNTDERDRQGWAERYFAFKGSRLETFDLQMDQGVNTIPSGYASASSSSAQLLNISAKRLYFQPNFFQSWTTILAADTARVSPVYRRFGRSYVADLTFSVPAEWKPERLPADVDEQTPFGRYSRSVTFSEGVLKYRRSIVLEAGTFSADRYHALVGFFKNMKKRDGESAVFVR